MEYEFATTTSHKDLMGLSETEKNLLKEKIAKWNGVIRVFVHPSFMPANHHEKALVDFPGSEDTEKYVKRILNLSDTPPVIVMEEHKNYDTSKQRFEKGSKQQAYFVETENSDSSLFGDPKGFEKLADLFSELGVQKVLIGDQILWIDTDYIQDAGNLKIHDDYGYEDQRPWVGGCVGKVIEQLNDPRFKIEISYISYPDNPSKLRNTMSQK